MCKKDQRTIISEASGDMRRLSDSSDHQEAGVRWYFYRPKSQITLYFRDFRSEAADPRRADDGPFIKTFTFCHIFSLCHFLHMEQIHSFPSKELLLFCQRVGIFSKKLEIYFSKMMSSLFAPICSLKFVI